MPMDQPPHGYSGNAFDSLSHTAGELLGEVSHQQGNVFQALAQGRNADGKNIQPVVEVASKLPLFDHSVQVTVGCSYQPNVDFLRPCAPQAFEFSVLQNAQKFGLEFQGYISNFVEKKCALICQFKPSDL